MRRICNRWRIDGGLSGFIIGGLVDGDWIGQLRSAARLAQDAKPTDNRKVLSQFRWCKALPRAGV